MNHQHQPLIEKIQDHLGIILVIREEAGIHLDQIFEQASKVIENKDLPDNLRLMIVTESPKFNFGIDEITQMKPMVDKLLTRFKTFKQAFVVKSPANTAYTMVYQKRLVDSEKHQVEIFSTEKAAIDWLSN